MSSFRRISASHLVDQREWEREVQLYSDKVSVHNLQVTTDAGPDVWGRFGKPQPALVSVCLSLNRSFESAAERDVVDQSTVHYGKLSKSILSDVKKRAGGLEGIHALAIAVESAAFSTDVSGGIIGACEVDILYPKGSMLGEGAGLRSSTARKSGKHATMLYLKNVQIPTLVGVNSNERTMKQPVIANVWVDNLSYKEKDDRFLKLERILVKTIEQSSFETLESLATEEAEQLMRQFVLPETPGSNVRIRLEKPLAVPFADAPAIEIFRSSDPDDPFGRKMIVEANAGKGMQLRLVKPYMAN
ncbi:Dihydroneopterin aldolase-domain-containing protein [Cryomyces antarcticus]